MQKNNLLYILPALMLLIYSGCSDLPSDVKMPQWDVDLNIPIINKSYTMDEILDTDNEPNITINHEENVFILQSDTFNQSTGVGEFLTVDAEESSVGNPINSSDTASIYLGMPEGSQLDSAVFNEGTLRFVATNDGLAITPELTIIVPGMRNPSGQVVTATLSPTLNNFAEKVIELKNYTYKEPSNQPSAFRGKIWVKVRSNVSPSIGSSITFDAYSSNFDLRFAHGYLPADSVTNKRNSFSLNLGTDAPKFRDKVTLRDASLRLSGNYKSPPDNPFPITLYNARIIGKKNDNSTPVILNVNGSQYIDIPFSNGRFDTSFTEENSSIAEFIQTLPDSVVIEANYALNPNNSRTYRTATNMDSIIFTSDFDTKSVLKIARTYSIDTLDVNIDQEQRDRMADGQLVDVTLNFENGIPLNSWVKFTFTDANSHTLFTLKQEGGLDSMKIGSAQVSSDGSASSSTISSFAIQLTKAEIDMLAKAYHAIESITMETTDPSTTNPFVIIRPTDLIKVNAQGKLKYRVNSDNGEGK